MQWRNNPQFFVVSIFIKNIADFLMEAPFIARNPHEFPQNVKIVFLIAKKLQNFKVDLILLLEFRLGDEDLVGVLEGGLLLQ